MSVFYVTTRLKAITPNQRVSYAIRPTTMPVRYGGSSGAINKSYRPSESQRIGRTTARKVIDLTQDSKEDEAGGGSEAESDKESEEQQDSEGEGDSDEQEESEDQDAEEQGESGESEEQEESEDHESSDAESQESQSKEIERSKDLWTMLAYPGISYSVTRYHHRPWGGGDEFGTVGIFNTEKEAKWAALHDYRETCEKWVDGWEYYWEGDPGDEEITLFAKVEDYEVQQETYRGTINRFQHQEKPWSPFITRSEPRIIQGQAESSQVYVVKEERRLTMRPSEIGNTFSSELGDLIESNVHNIYREENDANGAAVAIYEGLLDLEFSKTVKAENNYGLMSIKVDDHDEKVSYLITVEKRQLL